MDIKKFGNNRYGVNSYIVYDKEARTAVIFDPAVNYNDIISFVNEENLAPAAIILTHGHIDHIADALRVKEAYNIDIYAHELENEMLLDEKKSLAVNFGYDDFSFSADYLVKDKDILEFGPFKFSIMHTPGHTRGGICITCDGHMITGDTLFRGSMGRTDLYGGNDEHMRASLYKLSQQKEDIIIYPGHGPTSTIGNEKKANPFMKML